jgi:hypothetical protein
VLERLPGTVPYCGNEYAMKISRFVSSLLLFMLPWGLLSFSAPHHFKGLPHFSYFENYPQVPQDEYLGRVGHFETSLMIYDFQGITKLDAEQPNDVRMYLVLFDLLKNETYRGPLTLRIMDGDTPLSAKSFKHSEEESLYALKRKLPPDGDFSLEIQLDSGVRPTDRVPFLLSSQRIAWGRWLGIGLGLLIVFAAWGSRRVRVLQDRRENVHNPGAV